MIWKLFFMCFLEGNGNPLQYSYLGNPTDRGARKATVDVVKIESDTTGNWALSTSSLNRNVCLDLLPILEIFFNWAAWAVCILFSVASFANIFSLSYGCLFIFSIVSFVMQKLLKLWEGNIGRTLRHNSQQNLFQSTSESNENKNKNK